MNIYGAVGRQSCFANVRTVFLIGFYRESSEWTLLVVGCGNKAPLPLVDHGRGAKGEVWRLEAGKRQSVGSATICGEGIMSCGIDSPVPKCRKKASPHSFLR